jgi:hypothetical protein
MFKPAQQFATLFRLQKRTETDVNGAPDLSYPDASPAQRFGAFKPFYGAEAVQAGALQLQAGGTLTTWYLSDYSVRDRILLNDDPTQAYDIISVENVDNRNMYAVLKVARAVSA